MSMSTMYSGKIILAPMVRIGTLPMRLMALDFGADLVYSEEIIDWKFLRSVRRINEVIGTVDYIDQTDSTVVFRTCPREKESVILQLGTCDPERAVKVAKFVQNDVAGIDINMGCPKEFSVKGGMGIALLSNPEKAKTILKTVLSGVNCPVTCKIRVLEDLLETVKLCEDLASTGISALAVHGRTKLERPQHANRSEYIKKIAQSVNIPVIANGGSKEVENYNDILKFKELTECSSVMIARAAEWNVSIFRKEGKLPLDEVIKLYFKYAIDYDNSPSNTKYCIQNMLRELQETERGKKFLESQTLYEMCALWDMGDYYKKIRKIQECKGLIGRRDVVPVNYISSKEIGLIEMEVSFLRNLYRTDPDLPKTKLLTWTRSQGIKIPLYSTKQIDKLFQSTVTVNGKKYRSSFWEKNKRWAEQGAAIVCLCSLGIFERKMLKEKGILR